MTMLNMYFEPGRADPLLSRASYMGCQTGMVKGYENGMNELTPPFSFSMYDALCLTMCRLSAK